MTIAMIKRLVDNSDGMGDNESVNVIMKALRGAVKEYCDLNAAKALDSEIESLRAQVKSLTEDLRVAIDERDRALTSEASAGCVAADSDRYRNMYIGLRGAIDAALQQWVEWAKSKELDPLVMTLHITSMMITEQARWVDSSAWYTKPVVWASDNGR